MALSNQGALSCFDPPRPASEVYLNGASQLQASVPTSLTPFAVNQLVASRPKPTPEDIKSTVPYRMGNNLRAPDLRLLVNGAK